MDIELAGVEQCNALYWRARAEESRDTARRMCQTGPRRGMLEIAKIYDILARRADLETASLPSSP